MQKESTGRWREIRYAKRPSRDTRKRRLVFYDRLNRVGQYTNEDKVQFLLLILLFYVEYLSQFSGPVEMDGIRSGK